MGDVGNGDDAYHNGAFYLAANFGFYTGFKPRGDEPERPQRRRAVRFRHARRLRFLPAHGAALQQQREISEEHQSLLDRQSQARPLRRVLASRALVPHMKNVTPAVLFVGGWFDAEDLSGR